MTAPGTRLRLLLGLVGVGCAGWGGWKIITTVNPLQYWPVLRWGIGGIVVHDALVAPLGVLIGLLVLARVRPATRPWLRAGLLGVVSLVVLALALAGARTQQQNPTAVPTSPWLGLLVGLAVLVVGLGLGRALVSLRQRRAVRSSAE